MRVDCLRSKALTYIWYEKVLYKYGIIIIIIIHGQQITQELSMDMFVYLR